MMARAIVKCEFKHGDFDWTPLKKYPNDEWETVKVRYDPADMSVTFILEKK